MKISQFNGLETRLIYISRCDELFTNYARYFSGDYPISLLEVYLTENPNINKQAVEDVYTLAEEILFLQLSFNELLKKQRHIEIPGGIIEKIKEHFKTTFKKIKILDLATAKKLTKKIQNEIDQVEEIMEVVKYYDSDPKLETALGICDNENHDPICIDNGITIEGLYEIIITRVLDNIKNKIGDLKTKVDTYCQAAQVNPNCEAAQ